MIAPVSAPSYAGKPKLRIRGVSYPVLLPSWKDPRLHLASVFVLLHTIGQVQFNFRVSIPQIFASLLTCAALEVGITLWRQRVIIWPASALLTGNGIAFIMRVPGTEHGDWWSFHGIWIYIAVAAVSLLSKYLIRFRGRHVFNPSNFGLVLFFLLLGSTRTEPLEFWWGPTSVWLVLALGIIVGGALGILSRLRLLAVAAYFWLTFAAGIGVLALSGHAMSANWHLGPVSDGYFWRVLILSPEVFIFLSFMITDPKTVPEGRIARRVYAVSIGLISALLIAPQTSEFGAKVALLSSLTIVCAARPLVIVLGSWLTDPARRGIAARATALVRSGRSAGRAALGAGALGAAALFATVLVLAGVPARSSAGAASAPAVGAALSAVTVSSSPGIVSIDLPTGRRIARDAAASLNLATEALRQRDASRAAAGASGAWLAQLQGRIRAAAGGAIVVPSYRVERAHISLEPGIGQGPPKVVSKLAGTVERSTYAGASVANREQRTAFEETYELALVGGRFVIVRARDGAATRAPVVAARPSSVSKGSAAFAGVRLTNVASQVGLNFRQGAFRFGMSADPPAMMGGGLCWLDYDNDGWMDLFAVNSYADQEVGQWQARGGYPKSALFRNVKGTFVNVSRASGAGLAVRGNGCVAADLNGDGATDLFISTAVDDKLLWNNGDGTFTQGARAAGVVSFGWHTGAAVADVNKDGRPDLFVAGYADVHAPIPNSVSGFPTNHVGVRDLLFLNLGNGANGRARFREVGVQAGLERAKFEHGLGAVFTDVNGDRRPDLFLANDGDPNRLYVNVARAGGLGFRFEERGRAAGIDDRYAGMGVAPGDYTGDGRTDIIVTNSRGQPHSVFAAAPSSTGAPAFTQQRAVFAKALQRGATVGWGDSWVDFNNDGHSDLIVTNGAIPVTNLARDTEPIQVLENLGRGRAGNPVANASGVIDQRGLPKIIGRGLAAADFNNDGHVDVAINTIGGPLVLLENRHTGGHWLSVSLAGFHPGAIVTATLPDGRKLVGEAHAGSSYLSSEDPRLHFGLGSATKVTSLTVRYPDGRQTRLANVAANQIITVAPESR
jgi:ASPIC and UnbV/FG-GAP-like repeat